MKPKEEAGSARRARMKLTTNNVLEGLNIMLAVLSLAVVGVSAWLATRAGQDCLTFLQWPFMVIGLLMFSIGVLGYTASARRNKPLLLLYLLLLIPITLLFIAFTLFAVIVTAQKGRGRTVHAASFREYTPADFSPWLQMRVSRPSYWPSIQACLSRGRLCSDLAIKYKTIRELYAADLSPTQVGCCKPPSICGFAFVNATTWVPTPRRHVQRGTDCEKWNDNPSKLCFACDACRAGEMRTVRQHWLNVATVSLAVSLMLLTLLTVTSMALSTIKHNAIPDDPKPLNPNI